METRFPLETASLELPCEPLHPMLPVRIGRLTAIGIVYYIDEYGRKQPRLQAKCSCGSIVWCYISSWLKRDYAKCKECIV